MKVHVRLRATIKALPTPRHPHSPLRDMVYSRL